MSTEPGPLIIIGGHEDKEGKRLILKEIAKRVQGRRLVIATVASHEPRVTSRPTRKPSRVWALANWWNSTSTTGRRR